MEKDDNKTGMILGMIFSSSAIDSSGEQLNVEGCDISDLESGNALCNYEHQNENDNTTDGKKNHGEELVGRILSAKKIFTEKDCDSELEHDAWEKTKVPLIWGTVRLYDKAGHPGAQALAAQIRDAHANKEKILVRASIEGSTLKRDGNKLSRTLARRIAITTKPCNKSCFTTLISDPDAPEGFDKNPVKKDVLKDLFEDASKSEYNPLYSKISNCDDSLCKEISENNHRKYLKIILKTKLLKAISAGSYDVAPSQLTGGAALQVEDHKRHFKNRALAAFRDYDAPFFNKNEFKKFLKHRLPDADDDFIDHFTDLTEEYKVKLKKNDLPYLKNMNRLTIELKKAVEEMESNIRKPVFHYFRIGMDKPHIIECHGDKFTLDGSLLTDQEVMAMLNNAENGVAKISYINGGQSDSQQEPVVTDEEPKSSLPIDPLMEVGDLDSWGHFSAMPNPGIYVKFSLNPLLSIARTYGKGSGLKLSASLFKLALNAAKDNHESDFRIFRCALNMGAAWFKKPEDAYGFMRDFGKRIELIPDTGGTHKITVSFAQSEDPTCLDSILEENKKVI